MEHVNFNFKKYYSSKENINDLLKAMKLKNYEFGGIKNTYAINDNRFAFGMFVKNKENGKLLSIYVDAIHGPPCWDQGMDAAFNFGQDYHKRVIMFSAYKIDPRSMDEMNNPEVVGNYIELINGTGLDTYYIQLENFNKHNPKKHLEHFVLIDPTEDKASLPLKKLPSKNDFLWARFNIIFCETMRSESYFCEEIHFGKGAFGYPVGGFKIEKVWDENGGFINAVLDSDKQSDRDILDLYYAELKIRIPDYSIKWIPGGTDVIGVSVKILDNPFSEFVLNIDNAEGFVDDFHAHEHGFTSLLDDISPGSDRSTWEPFYFVDNK